MRILGIDPGSRLTGFGILEVTRGQLQYITSGCIKVGHLNWDLRLKEIYNGISKLILRYMPTDAAVEQIFMHKNAAAALKLGHARGAALVAIANHHLAMGEYTPRDVKKSIVGYGGAEKLQIQHMLKELLNLSDLPQQDGADALAVAMCHAHNMRGIC